MLSKLYSTAYWAVFALALSCFSTSAAAVSEMNSGLLRVILLSADCASEDAIKTLVAAKTQTPPKRADVWIAGDFVPACWAEDAEHDYVLADRHGVTTAIYRRAFREIPSV